MSVYTVYLSSGSFEKLNIPFNFSVCVLQAQTGEPDMSAESNVKAAINATEHVHSTPQPEKVRYTNMSAKV